MAISLYVGRMGSGKSYEVVKNVILPALASGRRVVSNVAGLDYEKIKAYLTSKGFNCLGELVSVTHEQVLEPHFFRTDKDLEQGVDSFIQPGDLIALDEIWRFWESKSQIPPRHMNFFRMHRHFAHPETGITCDVALITQDAGDANTKIRAVVEQTFRMQKHTALGSAKRYRVDCYQGAKMRQSDLTTSIQHKYDPDIFPLYSSHSQGQGVDAVEVNVDGRSNIFRSPLLRFGVPAAVLLLGFGIYSAYSFFNPKPKTPPKPPASAAVSPDGQPLAPNGALVRPPRSQKPEVPPGRLVGWYTTRSGPVFLALVNGRVANVRGDFEFDGLNYRVKVDGRWFSNFPSEVSK